MVATWALGKLFLVTAASTYNPAHTLALTPGIRLGVYEITVQIGEGGMGQVYRARDTKLNRDVALKVLPDSVANDRDRLARFTREAQTLASLNHPNIAHIHGLEESGGVRALVMEFVEGEDLSQRLARGPIRIDEALPIARQIAEALEAAHEQGIIHRDLKPANIKVRPDGTVKVLDFGLAKLADSGEGAAAGRNVTQSPTITSPAMMTGAGMILGTAAYMSPEQARGKTVDKRADIWAFGVVVYEMLTATRAFEGETLTDLLAAVVKHEPDWNALPPATPGLVRSLLRRCLQKDPVKRLHDIADARIEIQEAMAEPETPAVAHRTRRERVQWAWIAIAVGVAASVATWWIKPPPSDAHVVTRLLYAIPEGQSFTGRMDGHRVAISPDGTKLVYVANEQLYLRFMDQLEAQPIRGTNEDPMEPVFSPNGQEIAYLVPEGGRGFTAGAFIAKKIAVSGGTPVTLAELPRSPFGASWHDTRLVFGMNDADAHGIQAVPDGGGTPQWLVSIDPHTSRAVCPQVLDDDKHVVFTLLPGANTGAIEGDIVIQLPGSGPPKVLVHGGTDAHLLSSGQLAYIHENTVIGVPFNPTQLEVFPAGRVPLVDAVSVGAGYGVGEFAISRNGTLVYVPASASGALARMLVWVDRHGIEKSIQAPLGVAGFGRPRLSPDGDGTRLAVSSGGDIWIGDFTGEGAERVTLRQLTFDATVENNPVWMPHGRVAYDASDGGPIRIASKAVDGSGALEAVGPVPAGYPETVSPDGRFFIFHTHANVSMLLPLSPPGPARPLVPATGPALNAEISPFGDWIAYQAKDVAGRFQIYVRPFPAMESSGWKIPSSTGGAFPLWARNGRELFFISGAPDSMMMSVPVATTPSFTYGNPVPLFSAGGYLANVARNFDVNESRDGTRFLMIKSVSAAPPAGRLSLVVVSYWFDEVRAKMGIR